MPFKVLDVRGLSPSTNTTESLQSQISSSLSKKTVPFAASTSEDKATRPREPCLLRSIPTLTLYDDKGLELFDAITKSPDYYLTGAELEILQTHSHDLVQTWIPKESILIELGCGSMRKTRCLLEALTQADRSDTTYFAIDLSAKSLSESLQPLAAAFPFIRFVGLQGTYEDALTWLSNSIDPSIPRVFLWLGSSIGNLTRSEAGSFLQTLQKSAMQRGDRFLCGIDRRNESWRVALAYDDSQGITRDFILNGLDHVSQIFGVTGLFSRDKFEYVSLVNEKEGRHESYYRSKVPQVIRLNGSTSVSLDEGELIHVEYSYKYSDQEIQDLAKVSELVLKQQWMDSKELYKLTLFEKTTA